MKTTMPDWLHRIVARLLLLTMVVSAAGLTFGREILQDGPTVADSIQAMASASHHDGQSQGGDLANKACDHSCHNTSHFLGQLQTHEPAGMAEPVSQYVAREKPLLARDHTENPFRPPRFPA
ncbi:MAG: hypothetical protein ACOY4L_10700 [Pseudomonadota bacterium]